MDGELPLLALPISVKDGATPCSNVAVLNISSEFFAVVLDCDYQNDPLGLLALINSKSIEAAPKSRVQFYKADFKPGCEDGEIEVVLYEKTGRTNWTAFATGGEWYPIRVVITSDDTQILMTLRPTASFARQRFLDGVQIPLAYTYLRTLSPNATQPVGAGSVERA